MDKIRIDFFDILGYLVPGSALLMALWVAADPMVKSIWHIHESVHRADRKTIAAGLFMSYIFGFVLHALGTLLYDFYKKTLKRNNGKKALSVQDEWALIREYGEKHIAILERWYALRALAQNLSAAAFLCVFICLYKWYKFGYYEWSFAALGLAFLGLVLIKRSEIFHQYLNKDIASIFTTLKLSKK
jgi:hypothetical protein